jgi:hypothetical protein
MKTLNFFYQKITEKLEINVLPDQEQYNNHLQ